MKSVAELMDLCGRVAVVTGGAGHIGSAIAAALAECGAAVAIVDRPGAASEQVAAGLTQAHGVAALPLAIDLTMADSPAAVPEQVLARFGRLDILVNCAAFVGTSNLRGWAVPFTEQAAEAWRACLELNLTVPFLLTQQCAPALAESGHGAVINVASTYGLVGPDLRLYEGTAMGNPAAYAASKGGLIQLTRWLATVLAPRIRVNALTPGGVARNQPATFSERYVQRTPLGRMAVEEDFKGAAVYLASDLSRYVTGHNLVVDGGWTAW
jgi:NAD(P)-dependent dehydrogenase (short-subunit alcohol dehydrogenase family)